MSYRPEGSESQGADREIREDAEEFVGVYMEFVYRLAFKQYEVDYLEMRRMLSQANDESALETDRRQSEVSSHVKTNNETPRLPQDKEDRYETRHHSEKMKHQYEKKDTFLTDVNRKEIKKQDRYMDRESRKPSFKISNNYGYKIERNYRNIEDDRMNSRLEREHKKPSFKSPVPRAAESVKRAEAEELLRVAMSKKHELKTQLYEVESDIRKLKNIVVKPRSHTTAVAPHPAYIQPKEHPYSRAAPVAHYKRHNEPSKDSFRDDVYSEASRGRSRYEDNLAADNFDQYEMPTHLPVEDNAAFVRKLNQEKKEREVTDSLTRRESCTGG